MTADPPRLTSELTLRADLGPAVVVGPAPYGTRVVSPVTGGVVTGARINGTFHGPGADWVLVGGDGFGRLDVRGQVLTDDGASVYVHYDGLLELNEAVSAALADPARETGWDDQYFRTAPHFETGAPRYAWLQQSLFVGRGRITTGGVEYEVFRVG